MQKLIIFWASGPRALQPAASLSAGKPISASWRQQAASSSDRPDRASATPPPSAGPLLTTALCCCCLASRSGQGTQFSSPAAPPGFGLMVCFFKD